MKNLRTTIEKELDKLDDKWQALPLRTQVRYVLILFSCYLVLGIGVLVKVCYDLGMQERNIAIKHIEVPPVVPDGTAGNNQDVKTIKKQQDGRE